MNASFEGAVNHTTKELFMASLSLASRRDDHGQVSPVTLSAEWSKITRLLILSILSVMGSVGNIFMISSVMIQDQLKHAGNALIASVALADLLITSLLIPASVIVLLAGIDESLSVCKFQWFLATSGFLITVFSLNAIAIDNYVRLCTTQERPRWCNKKRVTIITTIIWFVGGTSAGLQLEFTFGFDYCTRNPTELLPYQTALVALFILLPIVITLYVHIRIIIDARSFMKCANFKANVSYNSDLSLARTNFYSFLTFIIFWLPFGIVIGFSNNYTFPDRIFYNTAWIGLCKSCFNNVIYCFTNRHFRNAYINLFHYCCCKTTVSVSRRQRNETITRPTADVRVHIIPGYNMYSYTSPQRSGNSHWSKRDVHEL